VQLKNVSSIQNVARSTSELQNSYNRLYKQWMGEHRNLIQTKLLVDLAGVKSGYLLDVACGLGYLLDIAEQQGATTFGLDISCVALHKAKAKKPALKVMEGNGEFLPFADDTFDYVTCLGSLEHFIHPDFGAQEIARVLKLSGTAAIMLPNSHNLLAIYNVYKTGGILPELQDFERFGTRVEWQAFLERNGLQVDSVHKFNTGFSRYFKKGRELFWYFYNILYRILGDVWIPLNLSFNLAFVCKKRQ
jgi:ubiquinone/menaquinone biosynthesis C-methylase UbiE